MKLVGARRLERSHYCPSYFKEKKAFKFYALIGLGGNIGNVGARFDRFIHLMKNDFRFNVVELSPILVNAAFGYTDQSDFSNAVLLVQTNLSPMALLKILQHYELKFKRKRSFKNAPRTLDLDILYMSTKVRKSKTLTVPHPGAGERLSVIVPLGLMRSL
ncbi:MAG: 2-amino-4-hydroxy-6-hydroxymethyldihydropteridine diphosphokinase [Campylobacter sp.]|nr:2-amino-4-hydroxy-6-hydroxymethyldihydropteridine diphosphokinase [Campylobacter sp.]